MTYKLRTRKWRIELIDAIRVSKYKEEFKIVRDLTWSFNDAVTKHFKKDVIIRDCTWKKFKVIIKALWIDLEKWERADNWNWG